MSASDADTARKGRMVAVVIAATGVLWLATTALIGAMGWPMRFAVLADLAAMAAFIWALVVIYQIWRARQSKEG